MYVGHSSYRPCNIGLTLEYRMPYIYQCWANHVFLTLDTQYCCNDWYNFVWIICWNSKIYIILGILWNTYIYTFKNIWLSYLLKKILWFSDRYCDMLVPSLWSKFWITLLERYSDRFCRGIYGNSAINRKLWASKYTSSVSTFR